VTLSGRFMIHVQEGSLLYVSAKFEGDSSIRSKVMRGPKISKLGDVIQATPTWGSFCDPHALGIRYVTLSHAPYEP